MGAYVYPSQQQEIQQQQQTRATGSIVPPPILPPTIAPLAHSMPSSPPTLPPTTALTVPPTDAPPASGTAVSGAMFERDDVNGFHDQYQHPQQEYRFGFPLLIDPPLAMDTQESSCGRQVHQQTSDLEELAQYLLCDSDSNGNVDEGKKITDITAVL